MKFTIEGFSQVKLVEYGLDAIDAIVLRYFIDFKDSGKMISKVINEKQFYWVKYEAIIEELPILKLNKADSVYRRLQKMVKANILESETIKQGGVYSYYRVGINYMSLISNTQVIHRSDINPNTSDINPTISDENPNQTDINPNHSDKYPEQKTHLLYPSTNIRPLYSKKGGRGNFNNYEQRNTDNLDEIEKKLLGWDNSSEMEG